MRRNGLSGGGIVDFLEWWKVASPDEPGFSDVGRLASLFNPRMGAPIVIFA